MAELSIIIPAHNEEKRIGKTLQEYARFFRLKVKEKEIDSFEIVVVLNGCKDNTIGVVENYKKKFKEIKYLKFEKAGKGFAVKKGFEYALNSNSKLIGFVDADLATPPEAFYDLVKNTKSYDGVIASRYIKGSVVRPRFSFRRIVVSRIFNFLVRTLFFFNFRDTQCGAKVFKKEVIKEVLPRLSMSQWAFDIDLLYNINKLGFRVKEIPTFWKDQKESKLNLKKASIQMFLAVIQLRILTSRLKKAFWLFEKPAGLLWRIVR